MNGNIQLNNTRWKAEVSLHGGQLLRAASADSPWPVIWLGKCAQSGTGRAVCGGSPVCWPWFGASPVPGRPAQGFARLYPWEIEQLETDLIRMTLPESHVPAELRDFPFELGSVIRLSDALELELHMKNLSSEPVSITLALHTYFAVGDCSAVRIHGLEQIPFTVKGGPEQTGESGPLSIHRECCRLYCPHSGTVRITDPVLHRTVMVEKENSRSTLVWNPGPERAAQIADLAPEEYRQFVCVEANRAGADPLVLPPGKKVSVRQRIRVDEQQSV